MDYSWLVGHPDKRLLIESTKLSNVFVESKLPQFLIDTKSSSKWKALYWYDSHTISFQKRYLSCDDNEEFINIILHELGHSTSKYTNRWERILANSYFNINQAKMLEEQIAEILSLIFRFTLFGTAKGSNLKQFVDYMTMCKSKYKVPWGEIESAIQSILTEDEIEKAMIWSGIVRNYLVKKSIVQIKEGVFNGE